MTRRDLAKEALLDAVRDILSSIVHALESDEPTPRIPAGSSVKVAKIPELTQVAKEHATDRFAQRFTIKQMTAEYKALRANVTRRWLARRRRKGERAADSAQELARFNAAVDWSLIAAVGWYDERLQKQQDDLQAADQHKDEFLAVLGHELRNPLAPLRTGMDLIERSREKPELLDTVQPMMERQLTHLTRLVDDLLDFARISRGEINLQLAQIDLNAVIETAAEQLSNSIRDREHRLVIELSSAPLQVLGDFERLTQLIANLLSNASKYSDAGGQISISSHAENEMAVVHVADTGFGIPTEHLETIFALFAQIPEHRKRTGGGGLGIGLALARRLAELQRGSIEATSKGQGLGSEFVLRLPLHRADVDTEERSRASTIPPVPRPLRVLVVDDNADAAKSLAILIQVMGHNAVAAHDGATALAQMKTFRAEIVFLDLGLPDMHGNDVAKQIRELKGGPVRIYAVTGWSQQGEKTQAAGTFDSHLVKPVSAEQIGDILASIQESPST